jgi:RNA 2',3'-cyclic 3'-phosphodiesterase
VESVGRVFAAVPIPAEVRLQLEERIKDLGIPGRVVPPEDWHITLRFLGTVDSITYERFLHGLGPLGDIKPFRLGLDGFGAFPNPRKATVFWVGVGLGVDGLEALNEVCERAAVSAGVAPEERPFRPHLTLARVRPSADVTGLVGESFSARWVCDRLVVFESRTGAGAGVRYVPLEILHLAAR